MSLRHRPCTAAVTADFGHLHLICPGPQPAPILAPRAVSTIGQALAVAGLEPGVGINLFRAFEQDQQRLALQPAALEQMAILHCSYCMYAKPYARQLP